VHRLIIIDDDQKLKGVLTLSDIMKYLLLEGATEAEIAMDQQNGVDGKPI
jgi:5'-AMP-activated protein kinase regulatory gamma subunit